MVWMPVEYFPLVGEHTEDSRPQRAVIQQAYLGNRSDIANRRNATHASGAGRVGTVSSASFGEIVSARVGYGERASVL